MAKIENFKGITQLAHVVRTVFLGRPSTRAKRKAFDQEKAKGKIKRIIKICPYSKRALMFYTQKARNRE